MKSDRDKEIYKARHAEQSRRNAFAASRAYRALGKRYPDEYRELYKKEKALVYLTRGPLPGDS